LSEPKPTQTEAESGSTASQASSRDEASYTIGELLANPSEAGFVPHEIAGALYGRSADELVKKSEVESLIKKWLKKPATKEA